MESHWPEINTPSVRRPAKSQSRRSLVRDTRECVDGAIEFLFSVQRHDHRWCAELESNCTITAEYVFLQQMLLRDLSHKAEPVRRYLLSQQRSDGSWSIAPQCNGDISTTAEVYLAMRILGVSQEHEALRRSERFILQNGGLEKIRIFTRIFFAMFGLVPWEAVPSIPPEVMLFSKISPVNIYSLSSWARGTMVPLFVIFNHKPVFALPNGKNRHNTWLDHLWIKPSDKTVPYSDPWVSILLSHGFSWKTFFGATDHTLKFYEDWCLGMGLRGLRKKALKECVKWILQRQEESGDWAGIFPPMINGIIALTLEGYGEESGPVKKGLEAIENFRWTDTRGFRIQACVSPVWDTALSSIALIDCGVDPEDVRIKEAARWVLERQILSDHGDWKFSRPQLTSGGWSFEYANTWYPDIDDTAAVLIFLMKQDPTSSTRGSVRRGLEWLLGMQNRDGGWGAFDVDNDNLFLNDIPFSDMESLCDPSSPDVTGRVLEAFAHYLKWTQGTPSEPWRALRTQITRASEKAMNYLRFSQEPQGSWFGRWGVNYIYGTSNVLCGLVGHGLSSRDQLVVRSLSWLKSVQNRDGGWGESLETYHDKELMGCGDSTASQTAWALMGLLGFLPAHDASIRNGITWLVRNQVRACHEPGQEAGEDLPEALGRTWNEEQFTGTGFPKHFYLRYNFYRHYFPMMALGRYLREFAP